MLRNPQIRGPKFEAPRSQTSDLHEWSKWTGVRGWWWTVNGSCFVSGGQSCKPHVARNSKFSREARKWGFYIQSPDFKMFATKFSFLLVFNTSSQTKYDPGPNRTHRVCIFHLFSLGSLRREPQLHGGWRYFCGFVTFGNNDCAHTQWFKIKDI